MVVLQKYGNGVNRLGRGIEDCKGKREHKARVACSPRNETSCQSPLGNTKVELLAVVTYLLISLTNNWTHMQSPHFKYENLYSIYPSSILRRFKALPERPRSPCNGAWLNWNLPRTGLFQTLHITPRPIMFHGLVWGLLRSLWECSLGGPHVSIFTEPVLLGQDSIVSRGAQNCPGKS